MIKVGIIGGAGYTAGELLRILLGHPEAEVTFILSSSHAGHPVSEVHRDLLGEELPDFTDRPDYQSVDVIFLCNGHGKSVVFLSENKIPEQVKIIDLSQDYRIKAASNDFTYGLPELNREQIRKANHIANPGCFATCIQLGLLPLAAAGLLTEEVHVNAVTGSTGSGQAPSATTHFSWRNNNVSVYKPFTHQHLAEIRQSLNQLQTGGFSEDLNFIPMRGNFARGIFASLYLNCPMEADEAISLYQEYYRNHPFVFISNENPDMKQVVNTNKAVLHLEKHGKKLLILSMIDNLVKGASGQAVQNMNLMFGLEETMGLKLKPIAF